MPSPSPLRRLATFLQELKRRKVYQVTAIYLILAVGGLELLDVLIPATRLPEWASPLILSLAIAGLPTVIVLAWTFDITPEGVVKTTDDEAGSTRSVDGGLGSPATGGTQADAGTIRKGGDPGTSNVRRDGGVPEDERTVATSPEPAPSPAAAPELRLDPFSVAVLPFENLSGAADAEPFASGIHDDLITELSRASALTVISRTSVRAYRDTKKSVPEVAAELGVGTIVEGGIQKSGDRVRLNVQLIDARTDAHRWAERYDCELTAETIFDLQSQLAARIMEALEAQLTAAEQAVDYPRPTDDLEAYRLYAMGREAGVDRSADGLREAIRHFEGALEHDPTYAHAWAGLGMALVMLVGYGHTDAEELVNRGRDACLKAVELEPQLPEALAALGNLHGHLQDAPAALSALRRAIEAGPGLAIGYHRASWIHLMAGDPEAAGRNARKATQLAPLEPEARGNLAMSELALGDPAAAEREARRALESHPDFPYPRWALGLALLSMGRTEEAGAEMWTIHEDRYRPWAVVVDGLAATQEGDGDLRSHIEELEKLGAPFKAAVLHAEAGDADSAFRAMNDAWPLFWDDQLVLRYLDHGGFGNLRDDPR
ncbi:MAG: tetratricopeptide repeat protein, partial [Longimicrobiales bacterium]|nr:tetratricopeptide repeat protein [Longimicrobiales bacterium]